MAELIEVSPPLHEISAALIQQAHDQARLSHCRPLDALQTITQWDMREVVYSLANIFGLSVIGTAEMLTFKPAFDLVPLSTALQKDCVLLSNKDDQLIGVIPDPFDADLQIWLEAQAMAPVEIRFAVPADIHACLSRLEETAIAVDTLTPAAAHQLAHPKAATVLSFSSISQCASPAVQLINSALYDALKLGASDIHLESTATGLAVKYRVDGVLDQATTANGVDAAEQVISRLKVLASLDIAERRIPQDGSFRVESGGRDIDLRVSIMPSIHGEDAVIRILDKRAMIETYGALTLEALGFESSALVTLRELAQEAYGMLLVTGPTGSGKTTTLYAALTEIDNGHDKIITIEDPVEYQLPGILQIPVNEKKGLTFAKGLRSILRHDPDKIMVGEIRDRETAEIAVQSALTGHLVLTTVHANNVFDVFGRFNHMGIDSYAFVSALNGIWAQRLIRLNCPHCSMTFLPSDADLQRVHLTRSECIHFRFKQGMGCGDCRGTGYKGRRAIAEILMLTDEIREMVIEKRPIRQIKDVARKNGTRSLRQAALALVCSGETTLSEIKRVTLHA